MNAPLVAQQPEDFAALEKRPLERYVAPAKPSLVGLSRAELVQALGEAGVPERQQRMRVQQVWHWLYVRGADDFDAMTTLSKDRGTHCRRNCRTPMSWCTASCTAGPHFDVP